MKRSVRFVPHCMKGIIEASRIRKAGFLRAKQGLGPWKPALPKEPQGYVLKGYGIKEPYIFWAWSLRGQEENAKKPSFPHTRPGCVRLAAPARLLLRQGNLESVRRFYMGLISSFDFCEAYSEDLADPQKACH